MTTDTRESICVCPYRTTHQGNNIYCKEGVCSPDLQTLAGNMLSTTPVCRAWVIDEKYCELCGR